MRHFYLDFIFTAIALAIAAWWGYSHGGMGGLIATLSITAILAVMEISLSFDNAVVNASVLKGWDEFWKKIVSIRPSPIAMASRDEVTTHLDHLE